LLRWSFLRVRERTEQNYSKRNSYPHAHVLMSLLAGDCAAPLYGLL
jgi:hypothetical protein